MLEFHKCHNFPLRDALLHWGINEACLNDLSASNAVVAGSFPLAYYMYSLGYEAFHPHDCDIWVSRDVPIHGKPMENSEDISAEAYNEEPWIKNVKSFELLTKRKVQCIRVDVIDIQEILSKFDITACMCLYEIATGTLHIEKEFNDSLMRGTPSMRIMKTPETMEAYTRLIGRCNKYLLRGIKLDAQEKNNMRVMYGKFVGMLAKGLRQDYLFWKSLYSTSVGVKEYLSHIEKLMNF